MGWNGDIQIWTYVIQGIYNRKGGGVRWMRESREEDMGGGGVLGKKT